MAKSKKVCPRGAKRVKGGACLKDGKFVKKVHAR
jgi:hypothetical protein